MCGIAGIFNHVSHAPVDRATLERMYLTLKHRGPDDEGSYISGSLGLGFRRLSIIDLATGHQPMSDSEQLIWVVFNGEIYNFKELRSELESNGHSFRTTSDTEVLVYGYKQWGAELLKRLNGMFGLAIWDEPARRLILARDRTGIKPLYYSLDSGGLVFGSELRAVIAANDSRPDIDPSALSLYLRYGYAPSPFTIYAGIEKLPAGCSLIAEQGKISIQRWWNCAPQTVSRVASIEEVQNDLLELYKQAVKRHLISDVPVGLLLSGGIDSGVLLALMNQFGSNWPTFTIGYGTEFLDDELVDAAKTAEQLHSSHVAIQIDGKTFEESLGHVVTALEEPINSASVVPMFYLCERVREDVKVALMGQGPDELFGGYTRHLGLRYGHLWRGIPDALRRPIGNLLGKLPRNEAIHRGLFALDEPDRLQRYKQVLSLLPDSHLEQLLRPELLTKDTIDTHGKLWTDCSSLIRKTDELGGFRFLELRYFMPDELLMYGDKLSMAHGLEIRVPFLDKTIVEYVERLPMEMSIHLLSRKWIHRRVCEQLISKDIIARKKRNFAHNVTDAWFRKGMVKTFSDIIKDDQSYMYQYLQPEAVRKLLSDHTAGVSDYHKSLYTIVVFEEWLRNCFRAAG
jgi:asparagine synthase (glutamine-hydrolysing)